MHKIDGGSGLSGLVPQGLLDVSNAKPKLAVIAERLAEIKAADAGKIAPARLVDPGE